MAENNSSGDKTEKPTPKRLRDARRDGNVAKSRDLSQTAGTFIWLLLIVGLSGHYAQQLGWLTNQVLAAASSPSLAEMARLGEAAVRVALALIVLPLVLVSVVGVLVEFLQVGPVFALKKITPQFQNMHPGQGFKRIVSKDNVIQTVKGLLVTLLLTVLTSLLILDYLPDALTLPLHPVARFSELTVHLVVRFGMWTAVLLGAVALADAVYQKYRHEKRLRMSLYDIRQEFKQTEGDPRMKGQRRQLARQWAMQDNLDAARKASALVVNPTHVAVALQYDTEECPVPLVTGKAMGPDALQMRAAALESGVPVMRNVPLARELNFRADHDDVVPEDLFDAVAEVLVWAQRVAERHAANPDTPLYGEAP